MNGYLKKRIVIQLFSDCYDLPSDFEPATDELKGRPVGVSFLRGMEERGRSAMMSPEVCPRPGRDTGYRKGLAWAARADLLREHSLYDVCLVGGGDDAILTSALSGFDLTVQYLRMNSAWAGHFVRWANGFYDAVQGRAAALVGPIFHLWHGTAADRRGRDRYVELEPFGFDPTTDLAMTRDGTWRWNSDKPEMHRYVRDYFWNRNEDG